LDSQYHSTIVVKIGGSTLGGSGNTATPDTSLQDLLRLHAEGYHIVLVHGGGNATSDLLRKMGEEPRFLNGLRVTDTAALQAATMMLRGVINAQLVDTLNRAGTEQKVMAIGMCGVDGRMLEAKRETRHGDIGFVGDVVKVNLPPLLMALEWGYIPVVAPLGTAIDDDTATIYNLNGDHAAAKIAAALEADACVFLTDVPGVLNKEKQTISRLSSVKAKELIENGTVSGGMIPKIESALIALEGSKRVLIIDGKQPDALYNAVQHYRSNGTTLVKRQQMQVHFVEPFELDPEFSYTVQPVPQDPKSLGAVYYRAYEGTIDFDWKEEEDAIRELAELFEDAYGKFQVNASLVALDNERIIGAVLVTVSDMWQDMPLVAEVFIDPDYRGAGVGKHLLQASLNQLLKEGYHKACLYVTLGNDSAITLYRRVGFVAAS
jgi:acetylglutamate kinase